MNAWISEVTAVGRGDSASRDRDVGYRVGGARLPQATTVSGFAADA